jgi:hypothetical protein
MLEEKPKERATNAATPHPAEPVATRSGTNDLRRIPFSRCINQSKSTSVASESIQQVSGNCYWEPTLDIIIFSRIIKHNASQYVQIYTYIVENTNLIQ